MSNCLKCLNSSYCLQCSVGFYLINNVNNNTQNCGTCPKNCIDCNDTSCFTCAVGFYLNSSYSCDLCGSIDGCLACSNSTYCTACIVGMYFNAGSCTPCAIHCLACNSSSYCSIC
jgi:hypothetical protein